MAMEDLHQCRRHRKKSLAGSHVATELITSKGDEAIFRTLTPFSYLYMKGNKIYSSGLYNQAVNYNDDMAPTFTKIPGDWSNGDAYALSDNASSSALVPESSQFRFFTYNAPATPADLNEFVHFTEMAGMQTTTPIYDFLMGERYILLVPPANQLESYLVNKGLIEVNGGVYTVLNKAGLVNYLKTYFINVNGSKLIDYPFPGARVQGDVNTFAYSGLNAVKLKITDMSTYLSVTDPKGNIVGVSSFFPRIYADGAVYTIEKPLIVD